MSDVLGNFVSRLTKFTFNKFDNKIPIGIPYSELEIETINEINELILKLEKNLENIEIRKSSSNLRSIWVLGNEYLQRSEPWKHYKNNVEKTSMIVRFAFNILALYSYISQPFIPDSSRKIVECLNLKKTRYWPTKDNPWHEIIEKEHTFYVPENLFKKITDKEVTNYKTIFSGVS